MCSYSYANYYTLEHSSPETYLASCSSSSRLYTVAHKANIVTTTIKGGIPAAHPSNTANRVTPATAEILTVNEEKRERKRKREKKKKKGKHVRRVRRTARKCACACGARACACACARVRVRVCRSCVRACKKTSIGWSLFFKCVCWCAVTRWLSFR